MNDAWSCVMVAFAGILSLSEGIEGKRRPAEFRKIPRQLLTKSMLIFWQILVIMTAMMLIQTLKIQRLTPFEPLIMIFFAFVGGYYLCRLRHLSNAVFVTVAVMSLFLYFAVGQRGIYEILSGAYVLTFATAFLWFLMEGLKRQVLFLNIPKRVQGYPIFILMLSVLYLIVSAIEKGI